MARLVKVTATSEKANQKGEQTVKVVLDIAKGCELCANPAGNDFLKGSETTLVIKVAGKRVAAKVNYPAGTVVGEKFFEQYKIYEGRVTITAIVTRPAGSTAPLEIEIHMRGALNRLV